MSHIPLCRTSFGSCWCGASHLVASPCRPAILRYHVNHHLTFTLPSLNFEFPKRTLIYFRLPLLPLYLLSHHNCQLLLLIACTSTAPSHIETLLASLKMPMSCQYSMCLGHALDVHLVSVLTQCMETSADFARRDSRERSPLATQAD